MQGLEKVCRAMCRGVGNGAKRLVIARLRNGLLCVVMRGSVGSEAEITAHIQV
jgi:hypothetical protein